jgi:hypothetical protein
MPADEHGPKWITRESRPGETVTISLDRMIAEWSRRSADDCENAPELLYVNSWCREPESFAMWEIYGSSGRGVAIKSSIGQYQRAARFNVNVRTEQYRFGDVEYVPDIDSILVDFSQGSFPMSSELWKRILNLGFHKRDCYRYENEWRAALYQNYRPDKGVDIDFDLHELISAVYVGPRSEPYFLDVVRSIMEKFEIEKPLERSQLSCPRKKGTPISGE